VEPSVLTFIQLAVAVLVALLVVRILLSLPGWVRNRRRPEARSILVVGVGGGGGNAVDRMVEAGMRDVGFVVFNTDAQALRQSLASTRIRIGDAVTRGLGSGGDPDVGRRAAEEDAAAIGRAVAGADLVFITAGMGGGTGSGAAPIVAAKAREQGALTIAVVTKPFDFEGSRRREIADAAAATLRSSVDAMISVPNDRVGEVVDVDAAALDAFRVVDEVVMKAVQGIVDLLTAPGLINLDFADVRAIMHDAGPAIIGLGSGTGEDRAVEAARQAISSPLLEASIQGARGILFHVSGPADLRLAEVRAAADAIRAAADPGANVIFGASFGEQPEDDSVHITLIATGLDEQKPAGTRVAETLPEPRPQPRRTTRVTPRSQVPALHTQAAGVTGTAGVAGTAAPTAASASIIDDLELPTFLRRRRPPTTQGG
jgi:cell division protein FtsZ